MEHNAGCSPASPHCDEGFGVWARLWGRGWGDGGRCLHPTGACMGTDKAGSHRSWHCSAAGRSLLAGETVEIRSHSRAGVITLVLGLPRQVGMGWGWLSALVKFPAAAGSRKLGGEKVSVCRAQQQTRLVQTRLAAFCRKAGLSPHATALLGEMGMRRDATHCCDELPMAARVPPLSIELNVSWGSADVTALPVSLQVPKVSLAVGTP